MSTEVNDDRAAVLRVREVHAALTAEVDAVAITYQDANARERAIGAYRHILARFAKALEGGE